MTEPSSLTNQRSAARLGDGERLENLTTSRGGDARHRVDRVVLPCGASVVRKHYGRKRGKLRDAIQHYGRFLMRKSGIDPRRRLRVESETIELWRRSGFDAPRVLGIEDAEDPPSLELEWIEGETLGNVLRCADTPLPDKIRLVERLARECGKRHRRAYELQEPRLFLEHPTCHHFLVAGDRLVAIDFEVTFIGRAFFDVIVKRELSGLLRTIAKSSGPDADETVRAFVRTYERRERFRMVARMLRHGTVPVVGRVLMRFDPARRQKRARIADLVEQAMSVA